MVWKKLADQFQKKTWANKLKLRRKLYSMRLKDGKSVQEHIKAMTEVFDLLSVIGDPVAEEDRVVHLLASLPESYNMLVTALEASVEVPKLKLVTERLLHEERKLRDREGATAGGVKAMTVKQSRARKAQNVTTAKGLPTFGATAGNLLKRASLIPTKKRSPAQAPREHGKGG